MDVNILGITMISDYFRKCVGDVARPIDFLYTREQIERLYDYHGTILLGIGKPSRTKVDILCNLENVSPLIVEIDDITRHIDENKDMRTFINP
ncbi:MAG: hypothetical protein V1870_03640 [Candidatus Aenigmatarchaeota archaeon]